MIPENRVVKFSVRRAWQHGCKARQASLPRKVWRDAPVVVRKSVDEMAMDLAPLEKRIVFRAVGGYLTTDIAARNCTVPMEMAARRGHTGPGLAHELTARNGSPPPE